MKSYSKRLLHSRVKHPSFKTIAKKAQNGAGQVILPTVN